MHLWCAHWFVLAAPAVLLADIWVGLSSRESVDRLVEAALLVDLAVLVPGLYWLCYRRRVRRPAVRVAALACLGIWLALALVPEPEPEGDLLRWVQPVRYLGLLVVFCLEVALVLSVYRACSSRVRPATRHRQRRRRFLAGWHACWRRRRHSP